MNTQHPQSNATHAATPYSGTDLTNGKTALRPLSLTLWGDGKMIAQVLPHTDSAMSPDSDNEARANLAFIVRACNSHEALVAALKYMVANAEADGWSNFMLGQARSALATAQQ